MVILHRQRRTDEEGRGDHQRSSPISLSSPLSPFFQSIAALSFLFVDSSVFFKAENGSVGAWGEREGGGGADILALKHESRILGQWSNPEYWFKEEPSQFSMGQTAESLTCSKMEKPHTRWDECQITLLSCFRASESSSV